MCSTDGVESGLDFFHVIDVLHRALFAGGDNQALLAMHQRNLRDFLDGDKAQIILRLRPNVDESSQAVVLAEMATRLFVARRPILDLSHGVESNERSRLTVSPQAERFLCCANCSRFATVLVHDNLRLLAGCPKAVPDEINLGLYHGEIILRPTLQNKARP